MNFYKLLITKALCPNVTIYKDMIWGKAFVYYMSLKVTESYMYTDLIHSSPHHLVMPDITFVSINCCYMKNTARYLNLFAV